MSKRELEILEKEIKRLTNVLAGEAEYCEDFADLYRDSDPIRASRHQARADRLRASINSCPRNKSTESILLSSDSNPEAEEILKLAQAYGLIGDDWYEVRGGPHFHVKELTDKAARIVRLVRHSRQLFTPPINPPT